MIFHSLQFSTIQKWGTNILDAIKSVSGEKDVSLEDNIIDDSVYHRVQDRLNTAAIMTESNPLSHSSREEDVSLKRAGTERSFMSICFFSTALVV